MTHSHEQLSKIVRLKKRAAENEYEAATRTLKHLDDQIHRTQVNIDAAGVGGDSFSGAELSTASKFVQRQLSELKRLSAERGMLLQEMEAARHKLKNIIVSETVLDQEQ